jgi:hypothetical protein
MLHIAASLRTTIERNELPAHCAGRMLTEVLANLYWRASDDIEPLIIV